MNNPAIKKLKVLSGAQLKYIAFLSMLIDHINKALIYPYLKGGALNTVSNLFDILGRIAFPIFVFLLVEGYFKTRNKWRYLATLLIFGVISEVPFDMFTTSEYFNINWNNIMFTLGLVLITIWVIDTLKVKMESLPLPAWFLVSFAIVAVSCLIAMNLSLDYEHHAIDEAWGVSYIIIQYSTLICSSHAKRPDSKNQTFLHVRNMELGIFRPIFRYGQYPNQIMQVHDSELNAICFFK